MCYAKNKCPYSLPYVQICLFIFRTLNNRWFLLFFIECKFDMICLLTLNLKMKYFILKDEVNSSQRNHASSWLRKVAVSMHFGSDTFALSVDLLDRFLATLKVCFLSNNHHLFQIIFLFIKVRPNSSNVWLSVVCT